MTSEEAIIRKLVADGDGTSEDKRICSLIQLIQSLNRDSDPKRDFKSTYNKIHILLDQIDFTFKKQVQVAFIIERETENYEKMLILIEKEIEQSEARMRKIKAELMQAKLIRKNRQEYDLLAKMIKEKPSRTESAQALKRLQIELDQALEKQRQLEQKLTDHRRNMYSLAVILNNINEANNADDDQVISDGEEQTESAAAASAINTTDPPGLTPNPKQATKSGGGGTVLNQLMQ